MKTFTLSCHVTVSAYTEVEANSPEEAIKIAATRHAEIGAPNTSADASECWVIEEADGSPDGIEIDE